MATSYFCVYTFLLMIYMEADYAYQWKFHLKISMFHGNMQTFTVC